MRFCGRRGHDDPCRIVLVAMEMSPVVKVGGLADMVGSLAGMLARRGHDVTVILPAYASLLAEGRSEILPSADLAFSYDGTVRRQRFHRLRWEGPRVRVFLLDDVMFSRREGIYGDPATGREYPDSADRYALFARGALEILLRADLVPDVVHVHDHQAALVPTLLRRGKVGAGFFRRTATVLTIHNLGPGHQGVHDPGVLDRVGLGREGFYPGGPLEFWGRVNFLKAGILDADSLTTVSPRYAEEIRTVPELGNGLEGVLAMREGDLTGILNGIDTEVWDPKRDPRLSAPYDASDLRGKAVNKKALLARVGFPPDVGCPLVGMISRLVEQKGIDLVRSAGDRMLELDLGLVVLGSGRREDEEFFREWASRRPNQVFYCSSFDDPLAHAIEAGADIFLMPSRYEPCGLNQMMSLRYGTVPVVHRVGGLADSVRSVEDDPEGGTGFVFDEYHPDAMLAALQRAVEAYRDAEKWAAIMKRGMSVDFSWERAVERYEEVYERAVERAQPE